MVEVFFSNRKWEIKWLRNSIFAGPDAINVPRDQEVDGAIYPKHQDSVPKGKVTINCSRPGKRIPLDSFPCMKQFKYQ